MLYKFCIATEKSVQGDTVEKTSIPDSGHRW